MNNNQYYSDQYPGLPCKFGSTVFAVRTAPGFEAGPYTTKVVKVLFDEKMIYDFGKSIFDTRAEAEAVRLKY